MSNVLLARTNGNIEGQWFMEPSELSRTPITDKEKVRFPLLQQIDRKPNSVPALHCSKLQLGQVEVLHHETFDCESRDEAKGIRIRFQNH